MKNLLLLSFVLVAGCHSSNSAPGVPCEAKTVDELAASLDKANGIGVDLQDPKVKTDIAAATKAITGKKYAFKGCKFSMQGNDVVSFTASDGSKDIDCHMKGGEEGVKKFRNAAMAIGQDKLKLDVRGTIASDGDAQFPRLALTACEISTHD